MTANYNRLNRRRGSGAWQWLVIGFIPGILCGGMLVLALALGGLFQGFGASTEATPLPATQVVLVVTATPDPMASDEEAATQTPFVITATPEPTAEIVEVEVVAATATLATALDDETADDETEDQDDVTTVELVPSDTTSDGDTTADTTDTTTTDTTATDTTATDTTATDDLFDTSLTTPAIPEVLASQLTTMVTIPGGTYTKGTTPAEVLVAVDECVNRDAGACLPQYGEDASPPYQVSLDAFAMEVTEVTFEQYIAFLNWLRTQGRNHLTGCDGFICIQTINENPNAAITFDSANYNAPPGLLNHPAYGVTWYGANAYCNAIGRRLPTEAEWERAARGDDGRIYPWGNTFDPNLTKTRIPRDAPPGTVPVGSFMAGASPYGVLDMAGNVAEWVSDWYSEDYYNQLANQPQPVVDPQGPPIALQKVLRGGSWDGLPFFARTVHRQSWFPAPDSVNDNYPRWVGFRCVGEVSSPEATSGGGVDPSTLGSVPSTDTNDTTGDSPSAQPTLPAPPEAEEQPQDGGDRG